MQSMKKGFTLLEMVVVLSMIAILSSVIWPVIYNARLLARRTASISNLHQCGLALRLYCDDYGGPEALPQHQTAAQVLKNAPTCDPNDTWRKSCDEVFGPPLIGSYAYAREATSNLTSPEGWDYYIHGKNPAILVSIYYANDVPLPFHGERPQNVDYTAPGYPRNYLLPDFVLKLRLDGSVKGTRPYLGPIQNSSDYRGRFLVNWDQVFRDEDGLGEVFLDK